MLRALTQSAGPLCLALLIAPLPTLHAASPERAATSRLRVAWATFLGGSSTRYADDYGTAIATDPQGNIYVTGSTGSHDFSVTSGAPQHRKPGSGFESAFVAAYDRGGRVRWATYLGGSGDDYATAIATDHLGNVYVTGSTNSTDFPVTAGAAQPRYGGAANAFVVAYTPAGRVRWATYLGGSGNADGDGDVGMGIASDHRGNIYVTGRTYSGDFPATRGAAQPLLRSRTGGNAFVAAYETGGLLRWATYLGGSGLGTDGDSGRGVAIDDHGGVYVTGSAASRDFPVTPGAAQHRFGGGGSAGDAFVAAYDAAGRARWATYLGGSNPDTANGIASDGEGNTYVAGSTSSANFPVSPGAAQRRYGRGLGNAFVAAYDRAGLVRWATYLGGSNSDTANAVATDRRGNIYVAGVALSTDFPVTAGTPQPTSHGGPNLLDGFVASYRSGGGLHWATYLGGTNDDTAQGVATGLQGEVFVAGSTRSYDFPVTRGAAQHIIPNNNAGYSAFVAAIATP